jgi:hypothetical protein
MAYEKSKKEKKAEIKGQQKIKNVRRRGQKQIDKMDGASDSKKAKLQSKALRLKKRESRLNQRFGQKAGNVGTSRAAGNYGNLDEVVVTAKRKPMGKPVNLNTGAKLTGYSLPGVGSREKNTESGFRNPEELKSRFN